MNKFLIVLVSFLLLASPAFAMYSEDGVRMDKNDILFEGTTADAYETDVVVTDPTADRTITIPDATGTVQLSGNAISGTTVTASSSILSTAATTIGWSVVAGANAACSATCTNACVFGVNTAATEADIVDCADTTADECLCAGAS
jgi:hypothetical protein